MLNDDLYKIIKLVFVYSMLCASSKFKRKCFLHIKINNYEKYLGSKKLYVGIYKFLKIQDDASFTVVTSYRPSTEIPNKCCISLKFLTDF